MSAADREQLGAALAAERPRDAVRLASRLARAGAWDATVAATLIVHARPGAPERTHAVSWLSLPLAAEDVLVAPGDAARWDALLLVLVEAGRCDEALFGLELAAGAGILRVDSYLELIVTLVGRGEIAAAWVVAALAVSRFPDDARAWSATGYLALERDDDARAERACGQALSLAPGLPEALLTAALVAARRGDRREAARLLDEARLGGVPQSLLDGYRRLAF
jgi:tetratricopeptide (TPR) repeat protein